MKVIIKRAFEPVGRLTDIPNDLTSLQQAVGGDIETVTVTTDMVIVCDEEGRIKGKPHNCGVLGMDFVGTILAVGVNGDEFTDVPIGLETWEGMLT